MHRPITRLTKLAFQVSRFRFWLYLGGTYMTGYLIGALKLSQFVDISFLLHLLYFTIPANIFLYGINDLADQDTDRYNVKKETKEIRIQENQQEDDLKIILFIVSIISFGIFLLQRDWTARFIFIGFYFLSFAYSFPPFRFKAKPIIDFSSNILYALPGILAYYQISGNLPPFLIGLALFFWTGAMHLFSAIPDIDADAKAGIKTTAVLVGKRLSLLICFILWFSFIFIVVVIYQAFTPISYIAFLYPMIPLSLILKDKLDIDRIYWLYPYINTGLGFLLSVLAGWDLLIDLINLIT